MLSRLSLEHVVVNTFGGRISTINKVLGWQNKQRWVIRIGELKVTPIGELRGLGLCLHIYKSLSSLRVEL
jgi:hypothetical protein